MDSDLEKGGFTLLEVLVAVSIMAIIAGLLLPAMSMARERARRVSCVNNLKNMVEISHIYAIDSGFFPGGSNQAEWNTPFGNLNKAGLQLQSLTMCPTIRLGAKEGIGETVFMGPVVGTVDYSRLCNETGDYGFNLAADYLSIAADVILMGDWSGANHGHEGANYAYIDGSVRWTVLEGRSAMLFILGKGADPHLWTNE